MPGPTIVQPAEMLTRLDALSIALAGLGWTASLQTSSGRMPCLLIQTPASGAEYIYCQTRETGEWFYWRSWAEPIAADASETAAILADAFCSGEQ